MIFIIVVGWVAFYITEDVFFALLVGKVIGVVRSEVEAFGVVALVSIYKGSAYDYGGYDSE